MTRLIVCISLVLVSATMAKFHHRHSPLAKQLNECMEANPVDPDDLQEMLEGNKEVDENTRNLVTCIATVKGLMKDDEPDMEAITKYEWDMPTEKQDGIETCMTSNGNNVDAILKCTSLLTVFPKRDHQSDN